MVWCSEKERSREDAQLAVSWDGCPGSGAINWVSDYSLTWDHGCLWKFEEHTYQHKIWIHSWIFLFFFFPGCSVQGLVLCTLWFPSIGFIYFSYKPQWVHVVRRRDHVIYCLHWNTFESDRGTVSNYTGTTSIISKTVPGNLGYRVSLLLSWSLLARSKSGKWILLQST